MRPIGTRKKLTGLLLVIAVSTGGAITGAMLDRLVLADLALSGNSQAGPDFSLISEAWDVISKRYVDRQAVQSQKLTYGAISGMVNALGDTGHSTFLNPRMLNIENHFLEGNISGIGAQIQSKEGHIVILAPIDDSPAQRAGLKSGDIILKVNGRDITGLPVEEAVSLIAGKPGTSVDLTVLDQKSGQTRDISIVRAHITVKNVRWERLPGSKTAHLRIAGFSQGVGEEVRKALKQIRSEGFTAIILDLRDNPGGVLDEAVETASQFLSGGIVVLQKNSTGDIKSIAVQPGGLATKIPLVVLINGGTASGSEIIAGAIKDADRAKLVGEKTFGTGTVLQKYGLSDGSAILIAIAEWITPAGNVIWHKGIMPDFEAGLPDSVVPLYPEKERGMNTAQLQASRDTQLLKALDLVTRTPDKELQLRINN
ncbi:Carboxyl-terminal protease [Syntrophobacter sp. SbD1]|nr:Carboxyl-terminal protease [Syntrophobacter sp. SbD1]